MKHIDCSGLDVRLTPLFFRPDVQGAVSSSYKRPYTPPADAVVLALAAAHKALFNSWRKLDGRVGKQGAADKVSAKMSLVYERLKGAC